MKKFIKNSMKKFQKDERGMTLVELLAVVVILAIVGLIAFVAIGKVIENSKMDAHVANAQQVISAAELYQASGGKFEDEANIKLADIDTLEEKLINPWDKGDSSYKFTLTFNDGEFTITSEGTDSKYKITDATKVELAEKGRAIFKKD